MTTDLKEKSDVTGRDMAAMQLHVMIDISSSMNECAPRGGKKIDLVQRKLSEFLKGKCFKSTALSVFDSELHYLGTFMKPGRLEEVFSEYLRCHSLSGGTRIWDCISDVLDAEDENESSIIACITDGADQGSRNSQKSILEKVKVKRKLELVILDITGQLKGSTGKDDKDGQAIIEYIDDPDNLDLHLEKLLKKASAPKMTPVDMKVSYPVIPLVECQAETVGQVGRSMEKIVPYLQSLTGLRYYPVTTCIVDRHLIHEINPERKRNPGPQASDLKKEIEEINQFITGIVLTVHCKDFCHPGRRNLEDLDYLYEGLSPLSKTTRRAIVGYCEYLPHSLINRMLDGRIQQYNVRSEIYLPEISSRPHIVENCY